MRYQLRPIATDGFSYDSDSDFYVYVSHYKASTGSTNEARRLVEATAIRADADALGDGVNIIYAGDFNMRSSSEGAFQELLSSGNGQAFDPINQLGNWHDNFSFIDIHTQSPVTSSRFGGQVTGGMDDRFDLQITTDELLDSEGLDYIDGSYHAFGNNGTHFMNGELDVVSNTALPQNVLTAIANASDHLPVVMDLQLPAVMDVQVSSAPATVTQGSLAELTVTVENVADVLVAIGADVLDYTLSTSGDVSGMATDSDAALDGGNMHTVTLDTSAVGMMSGTIDVTSTSQGVANGSVEIPIMYEVISSLLLGDANNDGQVTGADLIAVQQNFGGTGPADGLLLGDANDDGQVTGADLISVQQNFGNVLGPVGGTVPEPATAALLCLGLLAGRPRRRR